MQLPRPATTRLVKSLRLGLCALGLAVLAACGGGGSETAAADTTSGGAASTTPTSGVVSSSTPVTSTNPDGGTQVAGVSTVAGECGLPDFQASLLKRLNDIRAAGATCGATVFAPGAGALRWNTPLTQAALGHSQDMVARNYFEHTTPTGVSFDARITAAGYNWRAAGENIAAGHATVDEVVAGWMASEGHCRVIMNPVFVDVGAACVPGSSSNRFSTYWTMDIGAAR
ncbi:uncharacterized protein with SCP/PR1 domains [Burkholderiales bacterium JOSHI_001]|nr:uncharacterized protein with SCP/PR1 domains [Burkholderiales bacterium JOSHI_001]